MRGSMVLGLLAAVVVVGTSSASAAERRELGAHEHGHSTLAIAVEGERVAMELTAPGMDIVGFEHAAETDEQRGALEAAKGALADPLALFVLPPAAGCRVAEAKVGLEAEGHEDGGSAERGEGRHAEFHAEYALTCADPEAIGSITFAFFERFPGAEEMEVTLVTGRGQTSHEVGRDRPRLVLGG
jgi:Protein of unknown function (DUF2796)